MKKTTCFAAVAMTLALTGCAELQQQATGVMPSAQPQAVANQGATQVQAGNGTATAQAPVTNQVATTAAPEPSFVGDMVKTATDSVKTEAGSAVRSTIRGLFSN